MIKIRKAIKTPNLLSVIISFVLYLLITVVGNEYILSNGLNFYLEISYIALWIFLTFVNLEVFFNYLKLKI